MNNLAQLRGRSWIGTVGKKKSHRGFAVNKEDVMQWYYTKHGQRFGPVDEAELRRLARMGQMMPDDLVWNAAFGDTWASASSVEGLFTAPPAFAVSAASGADSPPPPPDREPGSTHNRDLMRMARESLQTHWWLAVGVAFLYQAVLSATSWLIPVFGPIASMIITGPLAVGLCLVFLSLARRTKAGVEQLFKGFNQFGTALCAQLLMSLFIFLWMLLLIVPGIIAGYAYSMTFYIIADDPSVKASDAITRSKEMMRGNKWKLFCLYWRFFWWILLCILTLGIGFLWLIPYMQTAMAHFYEDVR